MRKDGKTGKGLNEEEKDDKRREKRSWELQRRVRKRTPGWRKNKRRVRNKSKLKKWYYSN